jgi:hypothetical protein
MSKKLFPAVLAAAITGICLTLPAPVQALPQPGAEQVQPPRPRRADKPPILWAYAAVIVIVAAVGAANTIPSKRGHQD